MKKSFTQIKLKTTFLSLFLIGGYSPAVLKSGTPQPTKAPWEAKQLTNELTNQRSKNAKHFKNIDGSVSAFISPASVHYNAAGQWKDIVTDIEANNGTNSSTHPYAAEKNSVKTYFPANPFSNYILMSADEGSFKEKVSQICFMDAANNMISALPLNGAVSNVINGNTITYSGFYPGLSLVYSMRNDSRKFDLLINSPSFLSAIPAGAHHLAIMEEFVSDNTSSSVTKKEGDIFVNINNTDVLMFSQPVAFDNNTTSGTNAEGSIAFRNTNSGYVLQSNFPVSWIQNSQRVFPLHLDPVVNYYPTNATNWTGYTTSTTKTSGIVRLNDATVAAFAKFNIASIPVAAIFQTANYWGLFYTSNLGVKVANIRNLAAVDPVTTAAAALFTQATTGPSYNNNYSFGTAAYGWNMGALGATGAADIYSSLSQTWFGLGFSWVSGTTSNANQYGVNGTSAQICYLEVNYILPPCSGPPPLTTVVSPTNAVCNSANVALSLADTYTLSGLDFQWQASTQSAVGQWTAVTNATLTTFSTPTTNINTYYSVVVTCATGGTTTTTAGYVQIENTITNTPTYFEGFEGITNLNQLPNCSWSSSGGNSQTYTNTTTNNRVARTGTKFAAFAAGTATNYFYTNGLVLSAGITYSASMWYMTEATGLLNFTDLSMFIGSTQTTVNAIPVASTNGPAVASSYQRLSNVFTVPSSGIYYLAIRGTSNGGSYYLSFDDVRVNVPCSLNSPTLAVTGGTTTCSGQAVSINATGANTYTWSLNNLHTPGISVSPVVTANTVINYTVIGTSTLSGCTSTVVRPVTVNVGPAISVFPLNTSVCEGASTTLYASSANPAATFVWNTTGAPGYSTSVTPAASTVYSVNATTNANNCITTSTIGIDVVATPTVFASSSRNAVMCQGDALTLTASGATTYSWIASTGDLFIGSSVSPSPNITTTYMVTGTDAGTGCTGSASITQNVATCVGINNISASNSGINVYPNPNNGMFTVELNDNTAKTISVTDVTGRVLLTNTSSDTKVDFNINAFAAGIYYVKVQSNDKAQVLKVVKQ